VAINKSSSEELLLLLLLFRDCSVESSTGVVGVGVVEVGLLLVLFFVGLCDGGAFPAPNFERRKFWLRRCCTLVAPPWPLIPPLKGGDDACIVDKTPQPDAAGAFMETRCFFCFCEASGG
jgi:hypothetical protein